MGKTNGKPEPDPQQLDVDHELPPAGEQPSADVSAVETELQKVQAERDELLNRLARQQAEFENARRRAAREQHDYREYSLTEAMRTLLPVLDSFDRALKTEATEKDFRAGMELIDRQFHDALAKLGVTPIDATGQAFDPNLHQAVQMVETDEAEDNHVVDELQRGYRLKDRLLRPAMVRVARNPHK
jgi:molecular chaperone GrpE